MSENIFPASRYWAGPAHRQALPVDVPNGPDAGEIANVLAYRGTSGRTVVTVTWKGSEEFNLNSHTIAYDSPVDALTAGWELGEAFEQDARDMTPPGKYANYQKP